MEKFRNELEAQTTNYGWRRHCMTRCDSLGLLLAPRAPICPSGGLASPVARHRCIITTTSPSSFISRGTRDDISLNLSDPSLSRAFHLCMLGAARGRFADHCSSVAPAPSKSGGGGSERIVLPPEQSQTPSFLPREEAEKAEPTFLPGVAVTCR